MKILLSLLMLGFAAPAFAVDCKSAELQTRELNWTYSSFHNYYHCDFVERESEKILAEMGAVNVDVRCRGGLPHSDFVRVTATFASHASLDGGDREACQEDVRLRYWNDSCDLHERMIDKYLEGFEVRSLEKRSSCRDSRGRLEYNFNVLK